jgi:crotonobetainyl-CoA:carnitine CoA-transferase CaiB-like acyl-CoA transferase
MGGIMLGFGVVAAIAARERLGFGQKVEMSHLSASMFLQYWSIGTLLLNGGDDWPRFDRRTAGNPLWNHYKCADGEWLVIALLQPDRFWRSFCSIVGLDHLVDDPRFCNAEQQRTNNTELIAVLDELFATKPRAEWERLLAQNPDFIYDRVQRVGDVANDPSVIANGYITPFLHPGLGQVATLNFPVTLKETPAQVRSAAPSLGQHTDEVLVQELGYTPEQVDALRVQGVV